MPGRNYSQDAEKYANGLGLDRKMPAEMRGKKITPIEVVYDNRQKSRAAKAKPRELAGKTKAYDVIRKKGGNVLPPTMDRLMSELKGGR